METTPRPDRPNLFALMLVATAVGGAACGVGCSSGYRWMSSRQTLSSVARRTAVPAISHEDGKLVLVTVAHPHCWCTRTTVTELARLVSETGDRVAVHVYIASSPGERSAGDEGFATADTRGIFLHHDDGGREAAEFGAGNVGELALFSADGEPLFTGGGYAHQGHQYDPPDFSKLRAAVLKAPRPAPAPQFATASISTSPAN